MQRWRPWMVTAVYYDAHDPLSFIMALMSLVPIIILIFVSGYASAPSTHGLPALVLLMGLVFNAVLNAFLKRVIRSPRPIHPASGRTAPSMHGMPSDHAQFLFFFVTWLIRRAELNGAPVSGSMLTFLVAFAACVSYSRVYNGFHNFAQVFTGAVVGAVNGFLCASPYGYELLQQVALAIVPIRDLCAAWTVYMR